MLRFIIGEVYKDREKAAVASEAKMIVAELIKKSAAQNTIYNSAQKGTSSNENVKNRKTDDNNGEKV